MDCVVHQAPPSMEFSRQEYWCRLPLGRCRYLHAYYFLFLLTQVIISYIYCFVLWFPPSLTNAWKATYSSWGLKESDTLKQLSNAFWKVFHIRTGLPRWLSGKESPVNAGAAGDSGSIPVWVRSPGVRSGNLLQYSCLENPMEPGRLQSMGSKAVRHDSTDAQVTSEMQNPYSLLLLCSVPSCRCTRLYFSILVVNRDGCGLPSFLPAKNPG